MLKVFCANTSNAAAEQVIDALGAANTADSRHVVIVPDSYSLSVEREIYDRLGLPGSMNIEVVSFTRLAIKILGYKAKKCLTKEGAVLVLKKVINANADKLHHYNRVAGIPDFSGEMFAVIASFRNNGVTPEALKASLPGLKGGTRSKTADIALLYEGYLAELTAKYSDSTTRLEALIEEIPSSERVKESNFYLIGFDTFSGKQLKIVSSLSAHAKSVCVAVTPDNHGKNAELYPAFTLLQLRECAEREGVPIEVKEDTVELLKEPFNTINRNLFSYAGGEKVPDERGAVTLFCEDNIYEQFNGLAHEIAYLVRRKGFRYGDIAVVDCNPKHSPELKEIFTRYQIPHFINLKYPLKDTLLCKYLTAVIEVARFGYRADKVRVLLKNPLFSEQNESVFGFENAILKHRLDFSDFTTPFVGEELSPYEGLRARIESLASGFVNAKTAVGKNAEYATALVTEESVVEKLGAHIAEIKDENLVASNSRAQELLSAVLNEFIELIGDEEESLADFHSLLNASIAAQEIALIPQAIDSVQVGQLRSDCFMRPKVVFFINATADTLPASHTFKAIISAADTQALESVGLRLYPTPLDQIREEQYAFLDLITKPQKLYIGCAACEPDGTLNKPSAVVTELILLVEGLAVRSINSRYRLSEVKTIEEFEDAVVTSKNAFFTFLMNYNETVRAADAPRVFRWRNLLYASLSAEERAYVDGISAEEPKEPSVKVEFNRDEENRILMSVSRVEKYFRCPYSYFLDYGLRLKEREQGLLRPLDVGTIVHSVLEKYFRSTLGKLRTMSAEEVRRTAATAIESVFTGELLRDFGKEVFTANAINALREECYYILKRLTENVRGGSFEPVYIELGFGGKGERPPIVLETELGTVIFKGVIDRVDKCGDKVAVIDYKTGSTDGHVADVYFGNRLQLFVYLSAVLEQDGGEPAGVFYLPLKSGYTKDGASFAFKGQMLNSAETFDLFDKGLSERAARSDTAVGSDIIPVKLKLKASGEVAPTGDVNLLTAQQFRDVLGYVREVINTALKEMSEGYAAKKPVVGGCARCAYKELCGGVGQQDERECSRSARPYRSGGTEDDV